MKIKKGSILITAGLLLIGAACALVGYNLYRETSAEKFSESLTAELLEIIPEVKEEAGNLSSDESDKDIFSSENKEIPDHILNPEMEMPTVSIDGNDYIGVLSIPSLELELPVMSTWSYPALNVAPCRYSGSVYKDSMVIAAHNYRCHFADIQYLEEGARVYFTDVNGNVFNYTVALREILDATSVSDMTTSGFPLTLFTCNAGGYARVTVRCEIAD
ncbi:MAG: sortase [Ruminococcaceae bacterium]|nr:sortase [Oscillospiraceae bacterium]